MRRSRSPRALRQSVQRFLPFLLLAACDGGETAVAPQRHELRVSIVSGRGMVDSVRTPGLAEGAEQLVAAPVVARVHAVLDEDAGSPITGPGSEVRLPPVTIRWHTFPSWCRAVVETSQADGDGTAENRWHRATRAATCWLVAEGLVDGQVFDADTAIISFRPGPVASFVTPPYVAQALGFGYPFHRAVNDPKDAYGNDVSAFTVTAQLLTNAPPFILRDTLILAPGEGSARARLTIDGVSRELDVWMVADLGGPWRLEWGCIDLPPAQAGGAHTDSVHYRLDAQARYGSLAGKGIFVSFAGTLTTRRWERGRPVVQTTTPDAARYAAQRPALLEWSTGHVSNASGGAYSGGSLCEDPLDGRAWGGFRPVLLRRP